MRSQDALHIQRAQHRLPRGAEHGKERIPLSVHLTAATGGDGRANQPPVLGQHPRIPLPQCLDQTRRTSATTVR